MVLLLDNYDSFTYNLYHCVLQAGEECTVIRNDEKTLHEVDALQFDSIIISPGPKTPESAGITMELIARYHSSKPILGVCLGHQAIGQYFGAALVKATKPMHGKTSEIFFDSHFLFQHIESPATVMRYHSLLLQQVEQTPLQVIARTQQGEVMAVVHSVFPLAGVQFHPESVLTPCGLQLMRNWLAFAGRC